MVVVVEVQEGQQLQRRDLTRLQREHVSCVSSLVQLPAAQNDVTVTAPVASCPPSASRNSSTPAHLSRSAENHTETLPEGERGAFPERPVPILGALLSFQRGDGPRHVATTAFSSKRRVLSWASHSGHPVSSAPPCLPSWVRRHRTRYVTVQSSDRA